MEACSSRFTAAEGGARLVTAAGDANTIAADHTAFIAMRLLHEEAYRIRGLLSAGRQRSVYVTRAARVACVAYDLNILTDLSVTSASAYGDVGDWRKELETKEVLVCTSEVMKRILEDSILQMANINVLIIDSCHMIFKDGNLKFLMKTYKQCPENDRPRILALTYPLFGSPNPAKDNIIDNDQSIDNDHSIDNHQGIDNESLEGTEPKELDKVLKLGLCENVDDFKMYEKMEWKLDVLEEELCCKVDLAEDIDGGKRFTATVTKPKEFIIEYSAQNDPTAMTEQYMELDNYMRETIKDAMDFINEHRYDPTEIYGEDLYEELRSIPDPTIEPKLLFAQFMYILDQLGPYGADKAAFTLLAKLEKLKIKVPYERHFLLLCICSSVFLKIRSYADYIFSSHETEWQKIKMFSTPKVLRLVEILEKFKPPDCPKESANTANKNDGSKNENDSSKNENDNEKRSNTERLLDAIDQCDFAKLSDKIEDTVNTIAGDLKELDLYYENDANANKSPNENDKTPNEVEKPKEIEGSDGKPVNYLHKGLFGFRKAGHRVRGRRMPRTNTNRIQQMALNPDALCGIVFVKEPLMAKILFMIVSDLSRHHPSLGFLCAQYSAIEQPADPATEPRECDQQRRKQEEVLKKFRMHECNILLATSALEEGIDLPRCNLVMRWDVPESYRSSVLTRGRARAPRATYLVLSRSDTSADTHPSRSHTHTDTLLHHRATYAYLDQIISKKCGCGVQDEPSQEQEDEADSYTSIVIPYTPPQTNNKDKHERKAHTNATGVETDDETTDISLNENDDEKASDKVANENDKVANENDKVGNENDGKNEVNTISDSVVTSDLTPDSECNECQDRNSYLLQNDADIISEDNVKLNDKLSKSESASETVASVDLSSAIALINRYCSKLPSDTFTRLTPQWWMERVELPVRGDSGRMRTAYVCTLRLPLNCPVKFNIVGHPMPTEVLARRMVALQACRILHKSGELDDQLMPIGKDNFKAAQLETSGHRYMGDPNDMARPGTTKRRQYYYKRTARAFTDCEPIIDASDSEIDPPGTESNPNPEYVPKSVPSGSKRNMLYAIVSKLWCALPERYNTRGRRLHAPQSARQALALLCARREAQDLQIPSFPVYTRSGEVRVSVEYVPDADVRMSPRRGRLVRRFMRFVFAEVLRVRRRGMTLQSERCNENNYYVVPTINSIRPDGTIKIDIDWAFLELIYQHTEEKKHSSLERPLLWHQDREEEEIMKRVLDEVYRNNTDDQKDKLETGAINNVDNGAGDGNTVKTADVIAELSKDRNKCIGTDCKADDSNTVEKVKDKDEEISIDDGNTVKNNKVKDAEDGTESKTTVINDSGDNSNTVKNAKVIEKSVANNTTESTKTVNNKELTDEPSKTLESNKDNSIAKRERLLSDVETNDTDKRKVVKAMVNPLLKDGETFVFDPEKYREAVVTPWYRNQDQPQFFLVAEICTHLSPESAFPSTTHETFSHYYSSKYGVRLTQRAQPLLDVDHTSARLNLLTPRYVNRKGVALPVSSERTRRAKRDRLDQKQILVPELCRVHPFAAPLWFATVALPCVLYRINALLIADEIREAVAIDVALGIPKINDQTCPGFQWPPLDFGWSLAEVLNAEDKVDKKKSEEETTVKEVEATEKMETEVGEEKEKTINDILQEKEDAESAFEIGTWNNEMASSIPASSDYDECMEPLPSNVTLCTSASGGTNWCDPVDKPSKSFNPNRPYSMADSDCSYMSSDFDTDDSDLNSEPSDEDGDASGFCSSRNCNAAMGVRIEYKTAHEAEAVDLSPASGAGAGAGAGAAGAGCDVTDTRRDRADHHAWLTSGNAPNEYIEKFHSAVESHKKDIIDKGLLIHHDAPITELLPEPVNSAEKPVTTDEEQINTFFQEMFPYGTEESAKLFENGRVSIDKIEEHKRLLLAELKRRKTEEEIKKLNCFSMIDVNIDSPDYINEKLLNVGFNKDNFTPLVAERRKDGGKNFVPYYEEGKGENGFDFDYQPDLRGHPGPSPSLILQALTMSNANDGINLERLETIGDSYLKFAITAYLYCAHPAVHEGKLSHMRSKQVSNLNLYRLGRSRRLGARMIASKFEPHDNWLPPCHAPPQPHLNSFEDSPEQTKRIENMTGDGCFIPYNLITQHSIPDKSIADCVEALIGAYLLSCGARGALLFMSWLGLRVLPTHTYPANKIPQPRGEGGTEGEQWEGRLIGSLKPYQDENGEWVQTVFGELRPPPSPLLRYIPDPEGELEQMLSGYESLERTLQYRFRDRSLLLQALTHASHHRNRLTDCYQRLEFLGDAILDYLITRHLYEDARRHSPGALTDLRSALVNNTIFATLAVRHGFHKYFRHMSPGLNEVLTKYVKIQEENGHSISEEHYLIQEDEMEQAEDVEVPKALGDLFESVAGAIFLDSGMSLGAVWKSYVNLMGAELEAFSAAAPKSPVRELLEAEPDTAKFGKPERLADGRRVRVCVEVFGRGAFKGIGRNYRIAKGTAARCALRHLKRHRAYN